MNVCLGVTPRRSGSGCESGWAGGYPSKSRINMEIDDVET